MVLGHQLEDLIPQMLEEFFVQMRDQGELQAWGCGGIKDGIGLSKITNLVNLALLQVAE